MSYPKSAELAAAFHPRLLGLDRMLRSDMLDLGLSRTELSVLGQLLNHGPQRVTDLAAAERLKQPSMTALISRLEDRGWVRRRSDTCDGRVVLVEVSEDGKRAIDDLVNCRVAALSSRLDELSDEERAALALALPALD